MICPICQSSDSHMLLTLNCGNLDRSTLYPTIRLKSCTSCGHIFNDLSPLDMEGLNNYYNVEYAPANLNAAGLKSGNACAMTKTRYGQLFDTLLPYIQQDHHIMDVGCAWGGFLDYLRERGYERLSGVDMAEMYVKQALKNDSYRIELGKAEALPFEDNTVDVVIIEQVLEHLENPVMAFQEARRVLKEDGILCIGVPDASRYDEFYFFDYFWLLREHIQHFDEHHLGIMAQNQGFEVLESRRTLQPINSVEMLMPNLYVILKKSDKSYQIGDSSINRFQLTEQMTQYLDREKNRQAAKSHQFEELAKSRKPVYVWGIGREFLYLYESAGLKNCHIHALMDKNQFKQKSFSIDGIKVISPLEGIKNASEDSILVVTAIAHIDSIVAEAKQLGFKGVVFDWVSIGEVLF